MYVVAPKNYQEPYEEQRSKSSFLKKIFWLIIIIAIVIVGYVGVHFASAYRTIVVGEGEPTSWKGYITKWLKNDSATIINNDQNPIPGKEDDRLDALILGIRGDDDPEAGGLLTDTMLLVSIDKKTKRSAMISIPRDIYINMVGTLTDGSVLAVNGKINELYVRGLEHNEGLTFSSQMISRITGVYVDKAILFDFNAFEKLIDSLGGIDVYLAKEFNEKTQWGYEFTLPQGWNHLSSKQTLYYVRSRFSTSDFDRARRQQDVILAIKNRATELGFLANPAKVTGLLDALKGNVRTNFQIWEINDLLSLLKTFKNDNLNKSVLSTDNLLYETHLDNGEYVLFPKGDNFILVREYFKTILNE